MSHPKSRLITIALSLTALTLTILSLCIFRQFPDDSYHLVSHVRYYLYLGCCFSVCGFVGAFLNHAPSLSVFANYLILDTIIFSIPRIIVLAFLFSVSKDICVPYESPFLQEGNSSSELSSLAWNRGRGTMSPLELFAGQYENFTSEWTEEGCLRVVWYMVVATGVSLVASLFLQFAGALYVRRYALRVSAIEQACRVGMVEGEKGVTFGELGRRSIEKVERCRD